MDSKLTLVLLMNHLSKEWKNIRVVNVDPGAIKTKMTAGEGMPFWMRPIRNLFFKSPEEGAKNLYEAAFEDESNESGVYISNGRARQMKIKITDAEVYWLI
ncbi:MAG: hypothetical protein AAFY36_18710 [Bacteroidota bacterium]